MDVARTSRGAEGEDGGPPSVFEYQDRDDDLEDAFEKNIPFAIDVAESASDPANPVSHLGNTPADFEVEQFATSYGDPQPVEVNAKRSLGRVTMHWRVNDGRERTTRTREWKGGERYGEGFDVYYHRLRGEVRGTKPGDDVRVWFEGGGERSEAFTYRAVSETDNPVLVLASEDYSGRSPDYADKTQPAYLDYYERALRANNVDYDVYDIDGSGRTAPDLLGVLSHYRAIVWYTGDNERTIEPDQPPSGAGASKLADDEFREVRAFLNEGGRLLYTGEKAGFNLVNQFVFNVEGGPPYCNSPAAPCIPLSNDFLQYYLGAYESNVFSKTKEQMSRLTASFLTSPFAPKTIAFNGPGSADNQDAAYSMSPTSSVLPPDEYPLFRSEEIAEYSENGPLAPRTGEYYVYSQQADAAYKRLTRTVDLTGKASGAMKFQTSFDVEGDYDYVFVEARTAGQDDWTTLPDVNGNTDTDPGASCSDGWATSSGTHPFLSHYMSGSGATCTPTGSSGGWNAATGNSDGYQQWEVDLSEFADSQVEVSITYATDPFVQELGVFVDDVEVIVDGATVESTSFEDGLGGFTAGGPPEGSEPNGNNWIRSQALFEEFAGIKTRDTVYFGFGLEGIRGDADRADVMGRSLRHLGIGSRGGRGDDDDRDD